MRLDISFLDDVVYVSRKTPQNCARVTVIVTLEAYEAVVAARNRVIRLLIFKVKAINTTGAGNVFNAGSTITLSKDMGIVDVICFTSAIVALSTARVSTQGTTRRNKVKDFIKRCGLS